MGDYGEPVACRTSSQSTTNSELFWCHRFVRAAPASDAPQTISLLYFCSLKINYPRTLQGKYEMLQIKISVQYTSPQKCLLKRGVTPQSIESLWQGWCHYSPIRHAIKVQLLFHRLASTIFSFQPVGPLPQ